MKIVFLPWGPVAPHYYLIVAEDKTLRSKGQLGSLNTLKDVLIPDWYQAYFELSPDARREVGLQADLVVRNHLCLRTLATRLTS